MFGQGDSGMNKEGEMRYYSLFHLIFLKINVKTKIEEKNLPT